MVEFNDLEQAESFAKSKMAYTGQEIVVINGSKVNYYEVTENKTLKPLKDKGDEIVSDEEFMEMLNGVFG